MTLSRSARAIGGLPTKPSDIWEEVRTELTDGEKRYARQFVVSAGYRPEGLTERNLALIFHSLARSEELETSRRHNCHNWTTEFGDLRRRRVAQVPYIDVVLDRWADEGRIERLSTEQLWPDDRRFALVLSHDVDRVVPGALKPRMRQLATLSSAPLTRRLIVLGSLAKQIGTWRPSSIAAGKRWPTIDEWMKVEREHGFRSTFFFFGQPLPHPMHEDAFYRYRDKGPYRGGFRPIAEIIRDVEEKGWEVGLHGSRAAHVDESVLRREKENLEGVLEGNVTSARQHHLVYDVEKTPCVQSRAGLFVDSSLGSNTDICYRCGTGFPFPWFDRDEDSAGNLLSVPLVVQDFALFSRTQLTENMVVRQVTRLLEETAGRRGVLTLLWHNSTERDSPAFRAYRRILDRADELDAWGCSLHNLNLWWKERTERLVRAA